MRGYSAAISIVNVAKIKRMTEEYLDMSWTRILFLFGGCRVYFYFLGYVIQLFSSSRTNLILGHPHVLFLKSCNLCLG